MPNFTHNCKTCKYLGTFRQGSIDGKTHIIDLYFHRGVELTVVARYSNRDSDYASGLESPSKHLLLATLIAVRKGLLKVDEIPDYWVREE